MHRLRVHTLALVGGLFFSSPLLAQSLADFPVIRLGEQVSGSVPLSGAGLSQRGAFSVYRFDGQAGVRYSIEARAEAFDVYLALARSVGGITEFVREDDDSAGETDARIRFTAEQTEPYLLVVQALSQGSGGPFTLLLEERELPPAQPPRPLTVGVPVEGTISATSSVYLTDWDEEIPHDLWTFSGEGGQYYQISMESADFDSYLEFGPMSSGALVSEQTDDDGGEGTNSRLRVQLPHDGTFGIRARPLGDGGEGRYTLRVEPFTPSPPTRSPITVGAPVSATLTLEDAVLDGGEPYQEWLYQGEAGERLEIRMASDDFDSYLSLGRTGPDGSFQEITSNDDDPAGGLNSLITVTLPGDGEFVIRARSLGSGGSGNYTLELRRPF